MTNQEIYEAARVIQECCSKSDYCTNCPFGTAEDECIFSIEQPGNLTLIPPENSVYHPFH